MSRPGQFTEADVDILEKHIEEEEVRLRMLAQDALTKHQDTRLSILVDTRDIRMHMHGYQMIKAKAKLVPKHYTFGQLETDCYVAFGHWKKLDKFLDKGQIDLMEHLALFLPKKRRCIGMFTYQNGIQNTPEDFRKMGESIIKNLSYEKPLCIGIYNCTNGIMLALDRDLSRMNNEWLRNHNSIIFTRQLLFTLAEKLSSINSQLFWTHIAHSEGGLIIKEVLTTQKYALTASQKALKSHLITATFGGVASTPNSAVHQAFNIYSSDDITMHFARKYLDKLPWPNTSNLDREYRELAKEIHKRVFRESEETIYNQIKNGRDQFYRKFYIENYPYECTKDDHTVRVVKSLVPKSKQPFFEKDHAFQGDTYQNALSETIKELRRTFTIYSSDFYE